MLCGRLKSCWIPTASLVAVRCSHGLSCAGSSKPGRCWTSLAGCRAASTPPTQRWMSSPTHAAPSLPSSRRVVRRRRCCSRRQSGFARSSAPRSVASRWRMGSARATASATTTRICSTRRSGQAHPLGPAQSLRRCWRRWSACTRSTSVPRGCCSGRISRSASS